MEDIRLDSSWKLTQAANGDAPVVSGTECLLQDIRLESLTRKGNCFTIRITDGLYWTSFRGKIRS